jgi:hypothetical protein
MYEKKGPICFDITSFVHDKNATNLKRKFYELRLFFVSLKNS